MYEALMGHIWIQKLWCKVCSNCRAIQTEDNKDVECKWQEK